MGEAFAVLGNAASNPAEARRRVGQIALAADTGPEQAHIARMRALVGADHWPDRKLLVTVVDAETGEQEVLDHGSGAPLPAAVAPLVPPIVVAMIASTAAGRDGAATPGTATSLVVRSSTPPQVVDMSRNTWAPCLVQVIESLIGQPRRRICSSASSPSATSPSTRPRA